MRRSSILSWLGGLAVLASASTTTAQEVQNTFSGPTGGIRIIDAGSGEKGTFRLALNTEFFIARDYLVAGDKTHAFAGNLSLTITPIEYLEVFASAEVTSAWSNSNDPMLIQRVADLLVGLKGFYSVKPWVTVGGDFRIMFPGGVGDASATFRATSVGLRANASLDFRDHRRRESPLILRFTGGYYFDNTANLVEGIEDSRYAALGGTLPPSLETQHLLTAFERFAYGVNRVDTVQIGAGFEAPLRAREVGLHPMLEWQWAIPVNRQGYDCPGTTGTNDDGCLANEKLKAFPMMLTFGLRILPPPKGLAFTVGADIGLTGSRTFVRELAPTAPYNIIVGIGYAFDPGRKDAAPVAMASPTGSVRGHVLEEGSGAPIEGAVIRVVGEEASPQVTDAAGRFQTYALPEGEVTLQVSHPDYATAECPVAVPSETDCTLTPSSRDGRLRVLTIDRTGEPITNVAISVRGPSEHRLVSDDQGEALVEEIPPGAYTAHVDDPGYLIAVQDFEILDRQETMVRLRILPKPSRPRVVVKKTEIVLRRQITFATGSDEILPASEPLLLEIADALHRNPDIELVEVQGHTDNRGAPQLNIQLSQRRADSVRAWLVDHRVDPGRLVAKGYGPTRPIAPNITAYNRARNRRVQFKILTRAGGDATP